METCSAVLRPPCCPTTRGRAWRSRVARIPTPSRDAIRGRVVESYAYARVGYHRGLDALRRNGWKGHGPVPWSHDPNRGFLRCLIALQRAAATIDEVDEAQRCADFILDCDPGLG